MQQVITRIPWTVFGWFPDGIPIYGFGLMLFIAFIVCNWLTGRRAARMVEQNIGLGRYVAGPKQGENYPGGDKIESQVEAAKALVQDLAIWLFVTGLVGARLTYMYHHPRQAAGNFWSQLVDITNGGIILYGSVIGALVGYAVFCAYTYVRHQAVLNTLRIADLAAPAVALGIGLGRVGCLLNGCCYGHVACADCYVSRYAVQFPFSAPPRDVLIDNGYQTAAGFTLRDDPLGGNAVVGEVDPLSPAAAAGLQRDDLIVEANDQPVNRSTLTELLFLKWRRGDQALKLKVVGEGGKEKVVGPFYPKTLGLYPTQAFETVSMVLLFLLLLAFFAYRSRDGQVIALLMMCYAVHRTLNELLRADVRPVGFEAYSSYILLVAGAALMVWATTRPRQYVSEWELK
jgi:phosphatidylglycerol:prolipoprotein diacylglycerol transferase